MKLIHILLILTFLFVSVPAQEIVDLGVEADFYEMQADAKGVVHVFWMRKGTPYYGQLYKNEIINQEQIPNTGYISPNKFRPRISVTPDGDEVHFAYTQKDIGPNQIKHAYKDSSGWHIKTAYVADFSRLVQYAAGAVDGTGTFHMVAVRYRNDSNDIPVIYVRRERGGEYILKDYLSPKTVRNIWPDIYNDKEGNVHAVWSINKDTIHYRFAESGGDLSLSETIDIPMIRNSGKQPDIFADAVNNVHLCYLSYDKPGLQVNQGYSYASLDDLDFISTEHCNPSLIKMEGHYHDDPVIAATDPDNVWIAWAQETAADQVTKVRLAKKVEGDWGNELIQLDNDSLLKTDSKPAIAMSKSRLHIMWRSNSKTMKVYTETVGYGDGITSPEDGENVCGPKVYFEANMDPEEVSSVEFFVNGESIGTSSEEPFSVEWDASEATLGNHTFSITATQTDGGTVEDSITVILNCPPEISILNLVDNCCVSGTFDIELYAADDTDNLDKVELYIDGEKVRTFSSAPYAYTWNTGGLTGSHNVKAIAYEAGGQTSTDSVSVRSCPVYAPLNLTGEFSLKQTIFFRESSANISWESNPANSSVAEYRVYRVKYGLKELVLIADPGTLSFKEVVDDNVKVLAYSVTTVDNSGNESSGAFVVLEKIE